MTVPIVKYFERKPTGKSTEPFLEKAPLILDVIDGVHTSEFHDITRKSLVAGSKAIPLIVEDAFIFAA